MNQLPSERVILAAPMSFVGSAQRIWRGCTRYSFASVTRRIWDSPHPRTLDAHGWAKAGWWTGLATLLALAWLILTYWYCLVIGLILTAWSVMTVWYCMFGLWLVPYRIIRRGQRRNRRDAARHRELLNHNRFQERG
jgi:small-conductance mechanosensitive channel